jgi:hypothetical protein
MPGEDFASHGTGPLSYTAEEVRVLLAPIIMTRPDPSIVGDFIVIITDKNGHVGGWRSSCEEPEQALGMLAQIQLGLAAIIAHDRECGGHDGLHQHRENEDFGQDDAGEPGA